MRLARLWPPSESTVMALERWVNDGSPSGWSHGPHQVTRNYRPDAATESFEIPTVLIPKSDCAQIGTVEGAGAELLDADRGGFVSFPVHPDLALPERHSPGAPLRVRPTSSGRTVALARTGAPVHLKLHYPGLLGRAPRELNRHRVGLSTAVSRELSRIAGQGLLDPGTGFMPERFGCVLGDTAESAGQIGLIVRDASALVPPGEDLTVLPWFSLTGRDKRDPRSPSLLVQLAEEHRWKTDDFLECLVAPALRSYFELALRWGLIPEMHGQNTLLELNRRGRATRVLHRDLLDVACDPLIRSERGLPPAPGVRTRDPEDLEGIRAWRSWSYDFKFGEYTLEPMLAEFGRHAGLAVGHLRRECADLAHTLARGLGLDLTAYFVPWDRVSYLDRRIPDWRRGPELLTRRGPVYR